MDLVDLVEKYSMTDSTSSHEQELLKLIRADINDSVDTTDMIQGNMYAYKKGSKGKKSILLLAHSDKVGWEVSKVAGKKISTEYAPKMLEFNFKLIRVVQATSFILAAWNPLFSILELRHLAAPLTVEYLLRKTSPNLPKGTEVRIKTRNGKLVPGVVKQKWRMRPKIELEKEFDIKKGEPIDIRVGFDRDEYTIKGRGLDDSAGCAILTTALKEAKPEYNIHAFYTTGEEGGFKGLRKIRKFIANEIKPDLAIALDVGGGKSEGPHIMSPDLYRKADKKVQLSLYKASEDSGVPLHKSRLWGALGAGTEAGYMNWRTKIPSLGLVVPTKNIHHIIEEEKVKDLRLTSELLNFFLENEDYAKHL